MNPFTETNSIGTLAAVGSKDVPAVTSAMVDPAGQEKRSPSSAHASLPFLPVARAGRSNDARRTLGLRRDILSTVGRQKTLLYGSPSAAVLIS